MQQGWVILGRASQAHTILPSCQDDEWSLITRQDTHRLVPNLHHMPLALCLQLQLLRMHLHLDHPCCTRTNHLAAMQPDPELSQLSLSMRLS